ncbi:MAG: lipopolysaccharide biosynthesis protein [Cyanobacteria bacterium P01_C01_bin.120]
MHLKSNQSDLLSSEFDANDPSLRQKTLQSSFITFAAQPIKLIASVGSVALLARLLTPADFGIVSMVLPLVSFAESINSLSLGAAMIQRAGLTRKQANDIFWLTLEINLIFTIIFLASTPVLMVFYQQQKLLWVVPVMTLGIVGDFLSVQPKSLLARQLKFGILTFVDVFSLLLGIGVAIAAAVAGLGYWALALQFVVFQTSKCCGFWLGCNWRPSRPLKLSQLSTGMGTMLAYGANLSAFNLISRFSLEIDRILVGYFNGAAALGLYGVAYNWAYFPFNQIHLPLLSVANSGLSRAFPDGDGYRRQSQQMLALMFNLLLPILSFLVISGRPIMLVLLGDQWLESVPIFQVLVIAVLIGSFYRVTKWFYVSSGQTHRQLRWSLLHTPIVVTAAAIGAQQGPLGVAWGIALASLLMSYPAIAFCLKDTSLSVREFFMPIWRPAIAAIVSAGLLFLIQQLVAYPTQVLVELIVNGILYSILHVTFLAFLPGGREDMRRAIAEIKSMIDARLAQKARAQPPQNDQE